MICNTCGEKVKEGAVFCPNCGFKPTDKKHEVISVKNKEKESKSNSSSRISEIKDGTYAFLWGIIGYMIPLVGLILFIVWKDKKPKDSKGAGIGALVRVIVLSIFFIITMVIGINSN